MKIDELQVHVTTWMNHTNDVKSNKPDTNIYYTHTHTFYDPIYTKLKKQVKLLSVARSQESSYIYRRERDSN